MNRWHEKYVLSNASNMKKGLHFWCNPLIFSVGVEGFEPPTLCL